MSIFNKKEPAVLLLGDLFFFLLSLWLALALRTLELPSKALFLTHLKPFSFLFLIWVLVFYIAGLYEKHTVLLRSRLPSIIANTQAANSILAVIFFYFIPFFGITPKTVLFIYLAVSFVLILSWRMYGYLSIGSEKKETAVIIGSGKEVEELSQEINNNNIYNVRIVPKTENPSAVIVDFSDDMVEPLLSDLYDLIFTGVSFMDMHEIYEDIFKRVPLSIIRYNWFLENVSTRPQVTYDAIKRILDVAFSIVLLVVPLVTFPFIALAIKLEDGGRIFIRQDRIGLNNKIIHLWKFRSMKVSDGGVWPKEDDDRITKVGGFLRKTRLDEFPQLLAVLIGDMSGIGPRPDIYDLGVKLAAEIPYYNVRNIIKPGLSGWAQVNQDIVPHNVEETKERLAYDLYYIKNRSLLLDLKIGLRTIKTLLSRVGK